MAWHLTWFRLHRRSDIPRHHVFLSILIHPSGALRFGLQSIDNGHHNLTPTSLSPNEFNIPIISGSTLLTSVYSESKFIFNVHVTDLRRGIDTDDQRPLLQIATRHALKFSYPFNLLIIPSLILYDLHSMQRHSFR